MTSVILFIVAAVLLIAGAAKYDTARDVADKMTAMYLFAGSFAALINGALFAALAEILACLKNTRDAIKDLMRFAPEPQQPRSSINDSEPRWRVTGEDKETGFETSIVVQARSRRHAHELGQVRGLSEVTSIEELA